MEQYKYDDNMKFRFTKNDNNEYHSFDDKPSLEYLDGSIISWHKDGKLHRINKPALIRTLINGKILEEYYNDGKLHSQNAESFIQDNKFITSKECSLTIIDETEDKYQKEIWYGFNDQVYVPELLRTFIGINDDEKKSRPEITKLLNAKFSEYGLFKIEKNEDGKDIKVIIFDKSTATKLNLQEGAKVLYKNIQRFITQFYKDEEIICELCLRKGIPGMIEGVFQKGKLINKCSKSNEKECIILQNNN